MSPSPFVVGVGRSGTTLLRLMLDAHPELAIPPETHFIPQAAKACRRALQDSRDPRWAFVETVTTHKTWGYHRLDGEELRQRVAAIEPFDVSKALRAFYNLYAKRLGKPRWGDKTPMYVRRMRLIERLLPEARFVHVIRDGRDVALSYGKVWFGPNSVEEAARNWHSLIGEARDQAKSLGYYMEIRYEDLIIDTVPTLRRICDFVNLPWNAVMLDYYRTAKDRVEELGLDLVGPDGKLVAGGEQRKAIHGLTSKPPQSDRIDRWKTEMSHADRLRFEEIAGNTLEELGYEVG